MTCGACHAALLPDDRFCSTCGAAQASLTCTECGGDLRPGAQFCASCGARTSAPGSLSTTTAATAGSPSASRSGNGAESQASERRLTSVLFADLVSYTTLAESRDTEDVRTLLSQYFDVCKTVVGRYGGTIEKFIGDAVMAVWGVPTAHEDDAERAVRAGLELVSEVTVLGEQLGLAQLQLRAGVVTGEVSVTLGATDQGMVAGDPVNTASRVQAAAGPGEVWVDASTRALTAAAITYVDVGEHQLKGKAEPVRLFRAGSVVAGVGGVQRVDGLEAPLAGRERELRLIKELFHATAESGRPRLVVLDGEAGSGKSRLAWEFSKYIDGLSSTIRWHQGRCLSYGDGAAYWALAEAVRARLGLIDEAGAPESADALDRALRQWVVDEDERAWLGPRLASLLGEPIDAGREDLYVAWTRFFERLAEGAEAVVLVIDDGHHADDGLLDFVRYLVSSGRAPIFVLLLARPELLEAQPGLGGRRGAVVRLQPLPDSAMGALVDGLVVGLPAPARAQLVQRAEGVPLYAVETVRALIDRDLVTPQDGQYVLTPGTELDLSQMSAPASLHALVAARLDALSAEERRVVADASVLGASFTREGIEVLCHDVPHLPEVLESLCRKEVVAADSDRFSAERGQYRFMQTVVRQVAYTTLSRRDRKSRHLLVAEHLSAQTDRSDDLAVVIAQHLVDAMAASAPADPDVPDLRGRATRLLDQAASRACSLGSYTDGLRLLRTALAYCDDPAAHVRLLERAADTAVILTNYETAREFAQQALEARDADGDPLAAARAVQLYGLALVRGPDDSRLALEFLDKRLAQLQPLPGSDAAQLEVLDPLVMGINFSDPRNPRGLQLAHDQVRLAEQLQDDAALTESLAALAQAEAQQGAREVAVALNQHVLVRSRAQQNWRAEARASANLADSLAAVSPARTIDIAGQALRSARDHGLQLYAEITALNLTHALWCAGHWGRLAEVLTELDDPAEAHDPASRSMTMSVDLWRVDAGLPPLVTPSQLSESDDVQELAWQLHLGMMRARLDGDLALARRHAAAVMEDQIRDGITQGDFFMLWAESVRTAVAAGDLSLSDRLLLLVTERGPGDVPPALRAHLHAMRAAVAVAAGGDPESIERDLRAGVEAFESFGSPPYVARTQGELAGWLVGQGREAEAEPLFAAARATLLDLGASRWLAALDVRRPAQAGRG